VVKLFFDYQSQVISRIEMPMYLLYQCYKLNSIQSVFFGYIDKYRGYLCLAQCNVVKLGYYRNTYGIT